MRAVFFLAALLASGAASAVERIVTLAPHLAELVCAAGGCGKLVGVVSYTDFPPAASRLPKVGDAITVNLEQVLALKPDLILAWDGGTSPEMIARLRSLGLRVEAVRVRSLSDVAQAMSRLGELMQTPAAAGFAVKVYYSRLNKLRKRYWRAPKLRVMYQIEHDPIYTINQSSPISEAITTCGGENVFAGLPHIAGVVSLEAVVAADPDVVVFAKQDDVAAIRGLWARWPQSRAQSAGNLYAIDAGLLTRQAPRLLDGVEQLCSILDEVRAKNAHAAAN